MRILVATAYQSVVGGVETYLRAVLPGLVARGHEVGLLVTHPADDGIVAGCPDLPVFAGPPAALAWRPDVCYLNGLPDPAAEHDLAARVPTVAFAHAYSGLCVSGTRFHKVTGRACGRRLGPGCLAAYFPLGCGGSNPVTLLKLYRRQRHHRANFAGYHAVLAASRGVEALLLAHGVPADRVHRVPLFVPDAVPDAAPPVPRPGSGRVLYVGRLVAEKGWRVLIAAVPIAEQALGRRLSLTVVGGGPDAGRVGPAAAAAGVDATILGFADGPAKVAAMRAADVLAVPSLWPEPFGLVGIEAGCVGVPAVGFAAGGVSDWLISGATGELAPADPPTVAGLADALVRVLREDRHRHALGVGAWRLAHEFNADRHLDSLLGHLSRAAGV